jgi:hypothetical protein
MCATSISPRKSRPRQRNDTHVLGSDWNLSSAPPLSERTNDIGGNYGSRSFAVVDRHTYPDHPSHLALRRAPLNTAPIQFIVLKREGKWLLVKSKDLERVFSVQREAVDAAIRFANDSGKEGKPGVAFAKPNLRRFGHTERAPIRRPGRIYPWCPERRSRKNWRTCWARRACHHRTD